MSITITTSDGGIFKIPVELAQGWRYFNPESEEFHTNNFFLPFSSAQVRLWIALVEIMKEDKDSGYARDKMPISKTYPFYQPLISWHIVQPIADFLLPISNQWMAYATIVNGDKEAFATQGRYIRSTGVERAYHRITKEPIHLVYNNFFIRYDPAYSFEKIVHTYDSPNRVFPIYEPLVDDELEEILNISELNIISGILQSAYLKLLSNFITEWNGYPLDEELPPELVDWSVVVTLKNPHILSTLTNTYEPMKRITAINAINEGNKGTITFIDQAYAKGEITISPRFNMVRSEYSLYSSRRRFVIDIYEKGFICPISNTYQLAVYSVLAEAMMTKWTLSGKNESQILRRFNDCGLGPILSGGTIKNIKDFTVILPPRQGEVISNIDTLVPVMNLFMLYRSNLVSKERRVVTKEAIDEKDFDEIIAYGIKYLGSDNMITIAVACVNVYNIMKKPDQRLLTFATLIDKYTE